MGAIQIVVGDSAVPSTTDALVKGWLEEIGHTGTYVDDSTAENTAGFDGVLILDSCGTGNLGTKYEAVALPVVLHEGFYVDTMRMADIEGAGAEIINNFVIVDSTHAIANGPYGSFSGTVPVYSGGSPAAVYIDDTTVTFGAGVDFVAQSPTNTNFKVALAYESGETMASGTAPHKRGYVTLRDATGPNVNSDGIAILKNTYVWAFGQLVAPSVRTVMPSLRW